jgi:hypothetical protein
LILSRESTGQVASFLVKVIALEVVRRISKAKCPFVWNSIQALQVLGYPPFRWIQRWAPLKFVVQGIQVTLFLSLLRPWISWTVQAAISFSITQLYLLLQFASYSNIVLFPLCAWMLNERIVFLLLSFIYKTSVKLTISLLYSSTGTRLASCNHNILDNLWQI